jgi:hypothetical protein
VDAVLGWLVATGRADRSTLEPDLRLYQLQGIATAASVPPLHLIEAITALICLRTSTASRW